MLPTRKSVTRSSRQLDRTKTIVKRRKLQWCGHVSRSSGLAKTILQGTVKGGRRQGRQRKRWEEHLGMDKPGVRQVPGGSGEQGKMEKTGWKIICGAPTTLTVKGLMMMIIDCSIIFYYPWVFPTTWVSVSAMSFDFFLSLLSSLQGRVSHQWIGPSLALAR